MFAGFQDGKADVLLIGWQAHFAIVNTIAIGNIEMVAHIDTFIQKVKGTLLVRQMQLSTLKAVKDLLIQIRDQKSHSGPQQCQEEDPQDIGTEDLLESEDFPNLMFKSTGQEFAVSKQGVTAGISFESQINDDMGALSIVSDELLNIIVDAQTRKFWTYFWAWVGTQFSGSPKNKIAKTLTVAGLSAAKKAFRGMTDSNGRFIQCIPKALLVPLALEDPAEELFKWQWAGQDNTKMNVHHGRYEVIADPFLGADGAMSGATDTNWFMIGDTGRYPLGEFAVLRGFESPKIQEQWYDHKDALNYRALGTIGFTAYTDKLALVYSTGTSS